MSKKIKCLVWDLDNTLWDGILLEDGDVVLREGITDILKELDRRGILLSIASKNNREDALEKLREFGIDEYFIYPQIGWGSKADSISEIAASLNISTDTFAFIDDQPSEREEVKFVLPEVMTIDAAEYKNLLQMERFIPRFITEDSRMRRKMYQADLERKNVESSFKGSSEEFLATLGMELTVAPVMKGDLERVEELTVRTKQLNSTGVTYSFEELGNFITSKNHIFLIAELKDKFGPYGKIGLVLLEETEDELRIKLLLMSCRVMTRGIGSALLVHVIRLASERDKRLVADFIDTGRNRVMYITYKLMGFEEAGTDESSEGGDMIELVYRGSGEKQYPSYLKFIVK
ncbi:MAG: HAD-IIIC family phosphatase [Acetivibrionales bacterium]